MAKLDYQRINAPMTTSEEGMAMRQGITKARFRAQKALSVYADFLVLRNQKPVNVNVTLADGTVLYVYAEEGEDLTGKVVVLADGNGEPTAQPAPEGTHTLQDGTTVMVDNAGVITEVTPAPTVSTPQNEMDEKMKQMEEKLKQMEEKLKVSGGAAYEPQNAEPPTTPPAQEPQNEDPMKAENNRKLLELAMEVQALREALGRVGNSDPAFDRGGTVNQRPKIKVVNSVFHPHNKTFAKLLDSPVIKKAINAGRFFNGEVHKKPFNANDIVFAGNDYSGDAILEILSVLLLGGDAIQKGVLGVKPNIKFQQRVVRADTAVSFKDPSAMFDPDDSDVDVNFAKVWKPVKMEIHKLQNFEKLRESYFASVMDDGSLTGDYEERIFLNWWMSRVVEKTRIAQDSLYFRGKVFTPAAEGLTADYLGLVEQALADAEVRKFKPVKGVTAISGISKAAKAVVTVASTAGLAAGDTVTITGVGGMTEMNSLTAGKHWTVSEVLTSTTVSLDVNSTTFTTYTSGGELKFINESNIIDCLKSLLKRMNEAVLVADDFVIVLPIHLELAYKYAVANVATGDGSYYLTDKELDFLSERMVRLNYAMPNTIWASAVSNQAVGVDLLADPETARVIYEGQYTQNNVATLRISTKSDVKYVFGDEVTMCSALV